VECEPAQGECPPARQPLGIGFAPQLHGLRVIGSADHRHQRNDDHGPQGVALPLGTSCVGQLRERSLKERQSLKLKLLRKQLLLAETWHGPTSASRAPCPLQRFDQKSRSPSTAFDPFGENAIALPFRALSATMLNFGSGGQSWCPTPQLSLRQRGGCCALASRKMQNPPHLTVRYPPFCALHCGHAGRAPCPMKRLGRMRPETRDTRPPAISGDINCLGERDRPRPRRSSPRRRSTRRRSS
jgi:hypothetical protein